MKQIEKDVLAGHLMPGERLPSEEQLCEQFGASRTVVREAIQQLKGRGILRTAKGSGTYIANPSLTTLGAAVSAYSALAVEADFMELIDFRILIETECARLATRHADAALLRDLREILDKMADASGNKDRFSELDIAFHSRIASGSKNRMYTTLLTALEARCIAYAQANRGDDLWYAFVVQTHEQILAAITGGCPEKAAEAMQAHLIASREHFASLQASNDGAADDPARCAESREAIHRDGRLREVRRTNCV